MEDLDLGTRLGRIEAKLDAVAVSILSKDEALRDHEQRLRFIERFTYGATGVFAVALTIIQVLK